MNEPADLGILITDASLVVRSWDRWLETATGIPAELATGRPLSELAPGFEARGFQQRFSETLESGTVQVLSPALHRYLIPCPPSTPSVHFAQMQQRVHVGPLIDGGRVEGVIVTIADVTAQLDAERQLAADLASADADARHAAEAILAKGGGVHSVESFSSALSADDWKVRRAAVRSLARSADRQALQALVETLRNDHRSFNSLSSALKLLAMSDVAMTAPLAELLTDADADLRTQAALALGEQQDPAAVEPLLAALDDADPNVRFHVIEALGRLGASDAVDRLAAIVESGDFFVAFAAIDALALINDRRVATRLVPLLGDDTLRDAVASALAALGDEDAVEPLVSVLNTVPSAATGVARALGAIERRARRELGDSSHVATTIRGGVTADAERHLLAALETATGEDRQALVGVLGWLPGAHVAHALAGLLGEAPVREAAMDALIRRGEAAVPLLVARFDDDEPAVRLAAINAIGSIGSRRATAALLPLLDETPDMAIAAAGALARIGDPAAFDTLMAHVGHSHPAVRQAVVGALNSIGHADMSARIARLLDAEDARVRESAVRIAGYFGYEGTSETLLGRTSDPDAAVRAAAVEHLPFIEHPRAFDAVHDALADASPRVRAAAARSLARLEGAQSRDALLRALGDHDLWVRYYAARSLGENGGAAAVEALARSATADPAPHVRIAALDALGAIGHHDALPTLAACAADADGDVAAAALRALGRSGGADALPHLQVGARGPLPKMRLAAITGLAANGDASAVGVLAWVAGADTEGHVADAAIAALADVAARGGDAATDAVDALLELHGDARRADAASTALGRLGAAGAAQVARGLTHAQVDVRRRTIETLARMRAGQATRFIADALADPADVVRETAVLALARLGARGVQARLEALAREDPSKSVRRASAVAARLDSAD